MTDQELTALVQRISQTDFQRPFRHPARFNRRLRTTGGRYLLKSHVIEINPRFTEAFNQSVLIGIIKHELCHYHLHLAGAGYQHRDRAFKQLLKQVGGLRFAPVLPDQVTFYQYRCQRCGQLYQRRRRVNLKKYRCGRCHGKLVAVA